jgi:hypothetical protein
VLAYVFWHRPKAGVASDLYESALTAFHDVAGVPSWWTRLGRTPGADEPGWYEDWYLVEDWAALGELNEAAVTGDRAAPHGGAAALAADGIAGIYALRGGQPARPGWAAWLWKPGDLGYEDFEAGLRAATGEGASMWQRQMTLGPTPEFAVLAPAPVALPWPAVETSPSGG